MAEGEFELGFFLGDKGTMVTSREGRLDKR